MLRIGPYTLPNPFILAPMAGVSEKPFRVIAFRMGAALCPTELVSAQGLMRVNQRTLKYLRFDPEVERPYSLQIFGGEPEAMARAAVIGKEYGARIIDINMGCPVKKVTKNGAGSALLCEPNRGADLVRAIHAATGLPVTCKIRSGWDAQSLNYLQVAEQLFEAGCAALAVHPRTRAQGYSGKADWGVIADLKRHFPDRPIIGNGDVKTPADARRMLETTGCDFVMIGRGALGNPWIFRELLGGPPATPEERRELVLEHLAAHTDFVGEPLAAVRSFRKHLAWYAHGLHGAAVFRSEVNRLDSPEEVRDAVRRFFGAAQVDPNAPAEEEQDVDYRAALG
ncbi:tRNA dihydrouridine synthase DusB [Archangium sp.]|uniref:tRNA dihydrouridine synthase DusB n=1 Tax=Archangium sp. TaxID=1872627 RepID=UPI00286B879C|nr:tRNA dihydrouridine synthase DusB [Archangium sp.]